MTEILLFLTGIIVGGMNAIAGGGMLLGFPVLLAAGVPAIMANASSNLVTLPGQISSLFGYREYVKRIPKLYGLLVIPCVIGSIIGTHLLKSTPAAEFEKLVPGLMIFAVLLFAYQPFLHNMVHKHMHGPIKHRGRLLPVIVLCIAMFPLAIYGGFFGAGMGFIMLAFLGFTRIHEVHQMNALKNLMAICICTTGLVSLLGSGLIDVKHTAPMAFGSLIGGYYGARLAQRFSSHAIRIVVIAIGLSTAVYLVLRNY